MKNSTQNSDENPFQPNHDDAKSNKSETFGNNVNQNSNDFRKEIVNVSQNPFKSGTNISSPPDKTPRWIIVVAVIFGLAVFYRKQDESRKNTNVINQTSLKIDTKLSEASKPSKERSDSVAKHIDPNINSNVNVEKREKDENKNSLATQQSRSVNQDAKINIKDHEKGQQDVNSVPIGSAKVLSAVEWKKNVAEDKEKLIKLVKNVEGQVLKYKAELIPDAPYKVLSETASQIDALYMKYTREIYPPKAYWDIDGQSWIEVLTLARNTVIDFIPSVINEKPKHSFSNPRSTVDQVKFFRERLTKYVKQEEDG